MSTQSPPDVVVSEPPSKSSLLYTVTLWVDSLLIISAITLSLLLLLVILANKELRQRAFNQLVASMAIAGIIFNLLVRPGTILNDNGTYEMNKGYCGLFLLLQRVEWIVLPMTFWMMSIERLLILREPENYTKAPNRVKRAALIGVPWVFALVLSIVVLFGFGSTVITRYGPYPDDPYFDEMSQFVEINCMMMYSDQGVHIAQIVWQIFMWLIPTLYLFITGLVLLIVYCRQRGVKVCDEKGYPFVSSGSIAFCLILSFVAMTILSVYVSLANVRGYQVIVWAWSVTEIFAAILAMFALPDIRRKMANICCCHGTPDDEKKSLLNVAKGTQTPSYSEQPE